VPVLRDELHITKLKRVPVVGSRQSAVGSRQAAGGTIYLAACDIIDTKNPLLFLFSCFFQALDRETSSAMHACNNSRKD